jgi:hypothetical protein
VQSDIEDTISALKSLFLVHLHMSTILNLLIFDTLTYGLTLMIIGLEGEQPLEDFPNLIIVRHGYPWVPTDQAHGRPRQVGSAYQKTHRPVSGPNRPSWRPTRPPEDLLEDSPDDLVRTRRQLGAQDKEAQMD